MGGLICIVALSLSVTATHTIDLVTSNSIPCYCQEGGAWCAAATSQMILEGYPSVDHVFSQSYIYSQCQANNGDSISWSPGTDPIGVRDTLMGLGGDPGVNWVIGADPTKESVMYWTTYYMTRYEYPTAVLVNVGNPFGSFDHWVTITGFTTDVDPTTNSSATLQLIDIFDPGKAPCPTASSGGLDVTVTGSTWYSTYWSVPGNYSGSDWHGEYVVVVEPPEERGRIYAREQEFGRARIGPEEAVQIALGWVEEQRFVEREEYAALRVTVPSMPILANPDAEYGGAYYIVPFVYERTEESPIAVLVNAFTGEPQEIAAFVHPQSYVRAEEAFLIARRYFCLCRLEKVEYEAYLATIPMAGLFTRFLPVWQIVVYPPNEQPQTVFITMDRQVFEWPPEPFPGD